MTRRGLQVNADNFVETLQKGCADMARLAGSLGALEHLATPGRRAVARLVLEALRSMADQAIALIDSYESGEGVIVESESAE
jgi:hypothetical protein